MYFVHFFIKLAEAIGLINCHNIDNITGHRIGIQTCDTNRVSSIQQPLKGVNVLVVAIGIRLSVITHSAKAKQDTILPYDTSYTSVVLPHYYCVDTISQFHDTYVYFLNQYIPVLANKCSDFS